MESNVSGVLGFIAVVSRRRDIGWHIVAISDPGDYIFPFVSVARPLASPVLQRNALFKVMLVPGKLSENQSSISPLLTQNLPNCNLHVSAPAVITAPARVDILVIEIRRLTAVLGVCSVFARQSLADIALRVDGGHIVAAVCVIIEDRLELDVVRGSTLLQGARWVRRTLADEV